jgi:anaerobic magnesium-protoporphyrin IX monomethyl ester cyclase
MQKTLVLAVPPQAGLLRGFSSGIIALGNYIRLYDRDTQVIFADFGHLSSCQLTENIGRVLKDVCPKVIVGITGTTAEYQSMLHTARTFKEHDSSIITVFGGHHATPQDDVILRRHRYVDFVIRGEGEVGLLKLLENDHNLTKVPNLSFRDGSTIVRTEDAPLLGQSELDKLSPLAGIHELPSAPGKFNRVTYVSARGCPLKCSFCAVGGAKIRAKSIPVVIQDLKCLVSDYGYNAVAIEDNFFAHQPRRTLELCAAIERLQKDVPFAWDCQTRVESMRRTDIVAAMANAKCEAVFLGVESLVADHLDYLGKTSHANSYLDTLKHAAVPHAMAAGMEVYINLQLGIPGESQFHRESTYSELVRLGGVAKRYGRKVVVHPQLHVVYPGTPHFEKAISANLFGTLGKEIFEEFTPWEAGSKSIFAYLGKHFAHGTGGVPIGILEPDALRTGVFDVRDSAIASLSTQLKRMNDIPGISVFEYGDHLAIAS